MRWWVCVLGCVLLGCPGPAEPSDGGTEAGTEGGIDAGIDTAPDAPSSSASVEVRAQSVMDGMPVQMLVDARHRVTSIRADLAAIVWRSDVTDVRVAMGQQVDFLGGAVLQMQLPPGRYSAVQLDLDRLEMFVDDASIMETEGFAVSARCRDALDLSVGEEHSVRLEITGETLLDELATRLAEDPATEAIRESFKEAIRLDCE